MHQLPRGLVVRIRRSHRRGRGSIPRTGTAFSFVYSHWAIAGCSNQSFLSALDDIFLGSIVVSISACHAEDRGSIPRRGDDFFSPPFLDKWREITQFVCSSPLPLPPPIEKTLSFPPYFTAIHKWMPLCLKAWHSFSNKKTASAGNRTRAARALLQWNWQASILPLNHRCFCLLPVLMAYKTATWSILGMIPGKIQKQEKKKIPPPFFSVKKKTLT